MRIVLIHGWRVRDGGKKSFSGLSAALEDLGHETVLVSYGYTLTKWGTAFKSRKFSKLISTRIREGDAVVAHSNGCRVAWDLSWNAPEIRRMVWLNPALDRGMAPAKTVERVLVIHNRSDLATRLARWIPYSSWGDMGARGYEPPEDWSPDPRMENRSLGSGHFAHHKRPHLMATVIHGFLSDDSPEP